MDWKYVFAMAGQAIFNGQLSETIEPKEGAALVTEAKVLVRMSC